ncbi:MAG: DUF2752 domain-containing protein [Muribaculaceae bacterium]|nr:DUF2752 domain-containing protein [Muribaculaceae bacterium]
MNRRKRIIRAVAVVLTAAALTAFYLVFSNLTGVMLRCPLKWATGLSCPGCGSQRALAALAEGDLAGAVRVNYILPAVGLYLALLGAGWVFGDNGAMGRLYRRLTSGSAVMAVGVAIIIWMVVRNLAGL